MVAIRARYYRLSRGFWNNGLRNSRNGRRSPLATGNGHWNDGATVRHEARKVVRERMIMKPDNLYQLYIICWFVFVVIAIILQGPGAF